jgi:glycerol-3-phosphate dehydrogenase
MARDAVDAAVSDLSARPPVSRTDEILLVGAEGFDPVWEERATLAIPDAERLLRRYGSRVSEIQNMIDADPALARRLVDDAPYLRAEIAYAATHEGALHLDDVLTRRTRLSIETRDRGLRSAIEAARIVAPILGWDEATSTREIEHYRARVEAELDSQLQPDDHTADAARMGAPDVRTGRSE